MDAVTYPEKSVTDFINTNVIPLRIPSGSEPLATEFRIKWTPTLIILDAEGREHFRTVGFITAEGFAPTFLLGTALTHFGLDRFPETLAALEQIIAGYPKSNIAAEAVFWRGVAGYKASHDPKPLRKAYDTLAAEYPGSEWANRALPYRLIPL